MKIPSKFTIFGQTITVDIVESIKENSYGNFNDGLMKVTLAKTIEIDNKSIQLSQQQIESTFLHEVTHAMQFMIKGSYDENEAASYSNALYEVINSGKLFEIQKEYND